MKIKRDEMIHPFLIFAEPYQFLKTRSFDRYCFVHSIYLIESGTGSLQIGNDIVSLKPKSMLAFVPARTMHVWHTDLSDPLTIRSAYFDWKYVERPLFRRRSDLFIMGPESEPVYQPEEYVSPALDIAIPNILPVDTYSFWKQLFVNFSDYYDTFTDYSRDKSLEIQANFSIFLKHFLTWAEREDRYIDPRIKGILSIMDSDVHQMDYEHIHKYVRKLGLSRSYFQTLFKNQVGQTPKQYWNQIRIKKAKDDLKYSQLPITEISDKYKYDSVHYFSKAFKKATGETPTSFRKNNVIH